MVNAQLSTSKYKGRHLLFYRCVLTGGKVFYVMKTFDMHCAMLSKTREHAIRDERNYARHMDDIHANPLKHAVSLGSYNDPKRTF